MNLKTLSYIELASQLVIIASVYTIAFKVHTLLAGLILASHIVYELTGWLARVKMVEEMNRQKSNYAQQISNQLGGGNA
jgi:hypothetical protein